MSDLCDQHVGHKVWHGPHALSNLGMAWQTAFEPDVHVPVLVGHHPVGGLHVRLANHWTRLHRRVHLVSRAIEEAGIEEEHSVLSGPDTLFQVHRCPSLFIQDADL